MRADALDEISEALTQNRSMVRDSGYGMFRELLRYKLERQGKKLITIGRYETTTRACSACGFVQEEVSYRRRTWTCPRCGVVHKREINATKSIKSAGLA